MAKSVEVVRRQLCSSSCWTMRALRSSRNVRAIVGRGQGIWGLIEQMITGRTSSLIVASFQLKRGS